MTDSIEAQIRTVFNDLGMNPKEITHNDNLNRYRVTVGTEGTDERYYRDLDALGTGGAAGQVVDHGEVHDMREAIDGEQVHAGTLYVEGTESECILISIE